MNVAIYYGSSTGTTETIANKIATYFNNVVVEEISELDFNDLKIFDLIIFGSSTWGIGDLQDDWEDRIEDLKEADLNGKNVAVFGAGDQEEYPDSFVDAIGIIADMVKYRGGKIVGKFEASGYNFTDSKGLDGDYFLGLPIDEDNQSDLTDERVELWIKKIKSEIE